MIADILEIHTQAQTVTIMSANNSQTLSAAITQMIDALLFDLEREEGESIADSGLCRGVPVRLERSSKALAGKSLVQRDRRESSRDGNDGRGRGS